jgi:hypothetical protein
VSRRRPLRALGSVAAALALVVATATPAWASSVEWPARFLAASPQSASVAVDRNGAIHVAYVKPAGGIFETWYGTDAMGSWTWTLAATGSGSVPVVGVDLLGHVHIAQGCAYTSNRTGTWKTRLLPCSGGSATIWFAGLAVDPIGEVHVAGRDSSGNLIYSTNRRGFWTSQNLGPVNGQASIAIDDDRRVHVAAGSEYFTNVTGQWTKVTIPFASPAGGSAVVFRDGVVRFMGTTANGLEYAERDGSTWTTVKLGKGHLPPLFAVDSAGNGHVVVGNPDTGAFDYLTDRSGAWVRTPGVATQPLGLAVGPGQPALLVFGNGTGGTDLRLASGGRSPWERTLLSGSRFGAQWVDLDPSIAANAAGVARAAWTWPAGKGPGNTNAPGLYVSSWRAATSASPDRWITTRISNSIDSLARIAIDAGGHSHVVLRRETAENTIWDLWYGTDASGPWVWEPIEPGVRIGCLRIALGPTGDAFVTYDREAPGTGDPRRVYLASNRTGTWTRSPLPPDIVIGNDACPALDVDKNNRAHVVFYVDGQVRYVSDIATAGTFLVQGSWSGADGASIAVDTNVKTHILYPFGSSAVYRTNATGSWVNTTLDGVAERARGLAIEVGSSGPIAAWGGGGLQVAERVGGTWRTTALAGLPTLDTGLAVGPAGRVWVLYAEEQFTTSPSIYAFVR